MNEMATCYLTACCIICIYNAINNDNKVPRLMEAKYHKYRLIT